MCKVKQQNKTFITQAGVNCPNAWHEGNKEPEIQKGKGNGDSESERLWGNKRAGAKPLRREVSVKKEKQLEGIELFGGGRRPAWLEQRVH